MRCFGLEIFFATATTILMLSPIFAKPVFAEAERCSHDPTQVCVARLIAQRTNQIRKVESERVIQLAQELLRVQSKATNLEARKLFLTNIGKIEELSKNFDGPEELKSILLGIGAFADSRSDWYTPMKSHDFRAAFHAIPSGDLPLFEEWYDRIFERIAKTAFDAGHESDVIEFIGELASTYPGSHNQNSIPRLATDATLRLASLCRCVDNARLIRLVPNNSENAVGWRITVAAIGDNRADIRREIDAFGPGVKTGRLSDSAKAQALLNGLRTATAIRTTSLLLDETPEYFSAEDLQLGVALGDAFKRADALLIDKILTRHTPSDRSFIVVLPSGKNEKLDFAAMVRVLPKFKGADRREAVRALARALIRNNEAQRALRLVADERLRPDGDTVFELAEADDFSAIDLLLAGNLSWQERQNSREIMASRRRAIGVEADARAFLLADTTDQTISLIWVDKLLASPPLADAVSKLACQRRAFRQIIDVAQLISGDVVPDIGSSMLSSILECISDTPQ